MLEFSTKCDINGNRYQLIIDVENKTYKKGYYLFSNIGVNLLKKDIKKLILNLENEGFTEDKKDGVR